MSGRLIFVNFDFNQFPNGLCRAEVELHAPDGARYVGVSEGSGSVTGVLQCSARASIDALRQVVGEGRAIELLGVKSVHAFDSTIVVVSVGVNEGSTVRQFVGSYVAADGAERAAAVAVLNATNRYLGRDAVSRA